MTIHPYKGNQALYADELIRCMHAMRETPPREIAMAVALAAGYEYNAVEFELGHFIRAAEGAIAELKENGENIVPLWVTALARWDVIKVRSSRHEN